MPSVTGLSMHPGQVQIYTLTGLVPAGVTFSEPTAKQTGGPAGQLSQAASAMGASDAGGQHFTTLVTFTAATDPTALGTVVIANDVGADDDIDVSFEVAAKPSPETVMVDPTSFAVSDPVPPQAAA